MPSLFERFSHRTLARRVLVSMLLLALLPTLIFAGLMYWASEAVLRAGVRSTLHVLLQDKKDALERYVQERRHNADAIRNAPGVIGGYTALKTALEEGGLKSPTYEQAKAVSRKVFDDTVRVYGFENFLLFSPEGALIFAHKDWPAAAEGLLTGPLKNTDLAQTIRQFPEHLQSGAEISDFRKYDGIGAAAFVVGPVFKDDSLLCYVALQISAQALEDLLRGPVMASDESAGEHGSGGRAERLVNSVGETDETIAGTMIDDEAWIIVATRDDQPQFTRRSKFSEDDFKALKAALHKRSDPGVRSQSKDDDNLHVEIDYRGRPVVQSWAYVEGLEWGLVLKRDSSEAYALLNQIAYVVGILLLIVTVVVFFTALWLAESIALPIREAAHAASRVAEGDLSSEVQVKGDDETAALSRSIQAMTEQLSALIRRIQESSVALLSTATEIAATARQQERTVQDFGASTAESVAAVREISATNHELVQTMGEVATVAEHTAVTAAHGRDQLGNMESAVERLAAETAAVSGRLSVISERANTISMVVTTITKVADQTNLLSINAAIEAEKAGEAGLGFLVVAREIRRLADQTAVATLDIERVVKDMQGSVAAGVMEMDKFTDQVRSGVFEIRNLSAQLSNIIQEVQGLSAQFGRVNEGMRAQAVGAEQIREAMARLSDGAQQTAQSIVEFNRATSHMREAVGSLKDEVSRFTTKDAGERKRG